MSDKLNESNVTIDLFYWTSVWMLFFYGAPSNAEIVITLNKIKVFCLSHHPLHVFPTVTMISWRIVFQLVLLLSITRCWRSARGSFRSSPAWEVTWTATPSLNKTMCPWWKGCDCMSSWKHLSASCVLLKTHCSGYYYCCVCLRLRGVMYICGIICSSTPKLISWETYWV